MASQIRTKLLWIMHLYNSTFRLTGLAQGCVNIKDKPWQLILIPVPPLLPLFSKEQQLQHKSIAQPQLRALGTGEKNSSNGL